MSNTGWYIALILLFVAVAVPVIFQYAFEYNRDIEIGVACGGTSIATISLIIALGYTSLCSKNIRIALFVSFICALVSCIGFAVPPLNQGMVITASSAIGAISFVFVLLLARPEFASNCKSTALMCDMAAGLR